MIATKIYPAQRRAVNRVVGPQPSGKTGCGQGGTFQRFRSRLGDRIRPTGRFWRQPRVSFPLARGIVRRLRKLFTAPAGPRASFPAQPAGAIFLQPGRRPTGLVPLVPMARARIIFLFSRGFSDAGRFAGTFRTFPRPRGWRHGRRNSPRHAGFVSRLAPCDARNLFQRKDIPCLI